MQATSARSKARAIHDDTQAAMIRISPSWNAGKDALKPGPVRTYRKPLRIGRTLARMAAIAGDALAWSAMVCAAPIALAFVAAMVGPTGGTLQKFAGDVFALYMQALILVNIL